MDTEYFNNHRGHREINSVISVFSVVKKSND
jgi:hypothetical protein